MTLSIFCPSSHLILDAPRCEQCGWVRPPAGSAGEAAWGPIHLEGGLGGPGSGTFAAPAVLQGIVALPLNSGVIIGINLSDGRTRWRTQLDAGFSTRGIVSDGVRFLASICDDRPLEKANGGWLAGLHPNTGKMTRLWQAPGHQLSAPSLHQDIIILREASGGLVALKRGKTDEVIWRKPMETWWPLRPFIAENSVIISDGHAMHGEGHLCALSISNGELLWKRDIGGLLDNAPTYVGNALVYYKGKNQLIALDIHNGELLWQKKFTHLYSTPQSSADMIYIVSRGDAPRGQTGHYILQAIDPQNGESCWQAPLPENARANIGPLWSNGCLLIGTDDGRILACDPQNGAVLWTYQLGSHEDPIRSELVVADNILVSGTSTGRLAGLRIALPQDEPCSWQDSLANGDYEGAAASLALCGDWLRSAEIYLQHLNAPNKAHAIYQYGKLYEQAGDLALANDWLSLARDDYHLAGNRIAEAEVLEKMGDKLNAARLFEEAGSLEKAASLYEQAGDFRHALNLFARLGDIEAEHRLRPRVPYVLNDVEDFEKKEQFLEAAETALKLGDLRRAVDDFQKANQEDREFEVLECLVQKEGEPWSWERLAALAKKRGCFELEGETWLQLGEQLKAARAYLNAARQMEQRSPGEEKAIAYLYEVASRLFEIEGLEKEQQQCIAKIIHYRHLPVIVVTGKVQKAFKKGETNPIELLIRNVGEGVGHTIQITPGGNLFKVDESTPGMIVPHLAPGIEKEKPGKLYICPITDQIGELPFVLEWSWQDKYQQKYSDRSITPVIVKEKDEPIGSGSPVEIHYHGTVYHTDEGNVEIIGGDKVGGDKLGGDKMDGESQKGDRVTVGGSRVGNGATAKHVQPLLCPNCDVPINPGDTFCGACGTPLKTANRGGRKRASVEENQ